MIPERNKTSFTLLKQKAREAGEQLSNLETGYVEHSLNMNEQWVMAAYL